MITRRKLVVGGIGGAIFGLSGIALLRNEASLRFIGQGSTIISLLDTSTERILFVLGEQNDWLLSNIPGLTTVGNTRIDLVVATHRILATSAAREHFDVGSTTTVAIQTQDSLPPIRGEVRSVTSTTAIDVGSETDVKIELAGNVADHPDFLISIRYRDTNIALCSGSASLRLLEQRTSDLLALPGSAGNVVGANISPQLLVTNSPDPDLDLPQLEVFASDPSMVRIGDGNVSVRDDQLSS